METFGGGGEEASLIKHELSYCLLDLLFIIDEKSISAAEWIYMVLKPCTDRSSQSLDTLI